jgi:hypothetical protein
VGRQINIVFCRYAFGGQIAGPPNFRWPTDGIEGSKTFSQPSGDTGESWEVEGDRMSSSLPSALLPGATPMTGPLCLGRRHDTRGRQSGLVVRRVASLRVAGVMWTMKGAHILNVALGR